MAGMCQQSDIDGSRGPSINLDVVERVHFTANLRSDHPGFLSDQQPNGDYSCDQPQSQSPTEDRAAAPQEIDDFSREGDGKIVHCSARKPSATSSHAGYCSSLNDILC